MSWKAELALIILFSTALDYFIAQGIYRSSKKWVRNSLLSLSIVVNLGILFAFKYFDFFSTSVSAFLRSISLPSDPIILNLILPVGVSFYTFQILSYTIDVWRGTIVPEKHFGLFATFVVFFPQLVAGPIERAQDLLPQLHNLKSFSYESLRSGLLLVLWGFVKKVVIADRLSLFVNPVYNSVATSTSAQIFVATIFFAFQIYCDFSGYSDIAKGSARVLGFNLVDNFKRPYFSQSFDEFWKRWHISLSRWFKDYMYIPLGGNRVSKLRGYFNVFFVFLVSGLWHGASWTFVIWGALHGLYLIVERLLKPFVSSIGNWFSEKYILALSLCRMIITFAFVTFAWVFFRSNTFADSIIVVQKLFTFSPSLLASVFSIPVVFSALLIVMLLLVEGVDEYILKSSRNEHSLWTRILASPTAVRWTCYYSLLFLILLLGVFTQNEFIYFQF